MREPAPHDLLRLTPDAVLTGDAPPPDWASEALAAAPWVVVRRAVQRHGSLPVGLRGATRAQRWGGYLAPGGIAEHLPPEALLERLPPRPRLPALAALPRLTALLAGLRLPWGPTGSVGFELASGLPVVTPTSDLDGLIRCPARLDRAAAAALVVALARLDVRCDLQLETPAGAVALLEYARHAGPVAARGPEGPRLVDDCWAAP